MPTLIALTGTVAIGYALFALIGFIGLMLLTHAFLVEPWVLTTTRKTVHFPHGKALKIVLIGDFHVGPFKKKGFVKRVVKRANTLNADLVLLVGDFLFDAKANVQHLEPLKDLKSKYGVYAVLGNHENGHVLRHRRMHRKEVHETPLVETLRAAGVVTLHNEAVVVNIEGQDICLAGIDDLWSGLDDLPKALGCVPEDMPCILLCHNPDIILDPDAKRFDLIVSGHTHAGQVRLPIIGPISPIPQQLGRKYAYGIYDLFEKTQLAITRGVGESGVPLRFFAPPEVMLLTTKPNLS